MKKTFQSFVFGCRVNEAERVKIDKELVEAGYTIDLTSPSFLIINTCAITGKAEREAKQLINQLRKRHPEAKIVVTGCSATLWIKYNTEDIKLVDIIVPNSAKSSLVNTLQTLQIDAGPLATSLATCEVAKPAQDKFRRSNRLLVKIQDGCQQYCSYCIVPYLRGLPQSQKIKDIIAYINGFDPLPSEVILSAINTEAFGIGTKESFIDLIKNVLSKTSIPRIGFGSIHPWSLSEEFISFYQRNLAKNPRFVQFFHVPIQSGSQQILGYMRREYKIGEVIAKLNRISSIQPHAFIATDVIVGYLGETDELFEESYTALVNSPISRFHVFRFSNRPHTAAYYQRKTLVEPTAAEKKSRSERLIALSKIKYQRFIETLIGKRFSALTIAQQGTGLRILLSNQLEGILPHKNGLPGQLLHVTMIGAKDGVTICKES